MISDKQFLQAELDMGIGFHNEGFKNLAKVTADQFIGYANIKTVLDYGAGTGVYSDAFHNAGYDVYPFEIWEAHQQYINEQVPHIGARLVKKPISTDLMLFIEVAEHITDKGLNALFKAIKPTYILFSSTPHKTDNDIDWGHINIKSEEEWLKFFAKKGYILEKKLSLPTEWSLLLKNSDTVVG